MEDLLEHKKFIESKSKEIFEHINSIKLTNDEDYKLEITLLSGLSNKICKVSLHAPNIKGIKITDLVFKIFGEGGDLVDRDTELSIMRFLSKSNYGPKIYESDKKTYRVEEYLNNVTTLDVKEKHNPEVIEEMKKAFLLYNSHGDHEYYKDFINFPKKELFDYLLNKDEKQNIVNFTVKKLAELSKVKLEPFAKQIRESDQFKNDKDTLDHLEKIEYYLYNFEEKLYDIFPEKSIIALTHNDAHPLNVLVNQKIDKYFLIDHEFCCFNLVGVDMANYNIENLFFLGADDWPFYIIHESDFSVLSEGLYYNRFKDYIEYFSENRKQEYSEVKNIDEILEYMKSKDYYWRCLAVSGLLWFVWAINYLSYDEFANQKSFSYFHFSIDRLVHIYLIAKEIIDKGLK